MEQSSSTRKKQDPAWNHCETIKNGAKVQLKCIYCGKIFKGGGIFRIKEHLAGQKGNGVTCLKVEPDVRRQMLEHLNVISSRGKKQKLLVKKRPRDNDAGASGVNNGCGSNAEFDLLPINEILDHGGEDEVGDKGDGGNVRGRLARCDNPGSSGFEVSNSGGDGDGGGFNAELDMLVDEIFERNRDDVSSKKGGCEAVVNGGDREDPGVVELNPIVMSNTISKEVNTAVHMAIGRFFFDVGLPMAAAKSAYFQPMIDTIASQGPGAVGPSYHDLRSWILENSVREVRNDIDRCRGAWGRTGCSILVNEWSSRKGNTFVNFLVYCPEGTIFLRSADISNAIDSTGVLHELLKKTVEEVGEKNVLQVVTSCEDRYAITGKRLTDTYPTVFWSPCAGLCIDLMLEDIGKIMKVKKILDQAKSISKYIYTNKLVLNMMRRYSFGVDLVDLSITRASSDFMTLKQMVNLRRNLQQMVTSEEWMESPYSKNPQGFAVLDYISNQSFWSTCALVTRLTDPLLRLLRIVGSEKRPAMGFVYAGLYRAKETIKKELVNKKEYMVYWKIIDHRWEQLQRHPLHAAGFYFNPKFFYSLEGDAHYHIRSLVYDCIEKMVPDPQIQDKIMKETASYHGCLGDFGRQMAIRARDTLLPTEWWLTFGGGCPNLTRLAVRILSQSCSMIQHKLNRLPLDLMHEQKNCFEHQRLTDLVFVQYNTSLKQMLLSDKKQENVDPISYENINIVGDWVMEKEIGLGGLGTAEWMTIDPPLGNVSSPSDDIEALGSGFNDHEIFDASKLERR